MRPQLSQGKIGDSIKVMGAIFYWQFGVQVAYTLAAKSWLRDNIALKNAKRILVEDVEPLSCVILLGA